MTEERKFAFVSMVSSESGNIQVIKRQKARARLAGDAALLSRSNEKKEPDEEAEMECDEAHNGDYFLRGRMCEREGGLGQHLFLLFSPQTPGSR